jgi:hypothetical protein
LEALIASNEGASSPDLSAAGSPWSMSQHLGTSSLRYQKFFLDSDLQEQLGTLSSPAAISSIPQHVLNEIGDSAQRRGIAMQYFDSIHQWMPIVSKVKWDRLLASDLENNLGADHVFLLLSMKLIQSVPADTPGAMACPLYTMAKEYATIIEMAGLYTLAKLQGNLLVTVYEMGHGIFPSAYLSLGNCTTLAIALGIHNEAAPQILEKPRNRIEWEERLRTWWMIRILDRFVNFPDKNKAFD